MIEINKISESGDSKELKIIKLGTTWCPPCQQLDKILSEIEYKNIFKIDIDNNKDVAQKFEIRTIPVMLFMKDNKIMEQTGLLSKEDIMERIERYKG